MKTKLNLSPMLTYSTHVTAHNKGGFEEEYRFDDARINIGIDLLSYLNHL